MGAHARRRGFNHGPGGRVGYQRGKHRVIELVATAHGTVGPQNRRSSERKIADRVESLVPDELVGKPQPFRVDDPVLGQNEGVLK